MTTKTIREIALAWKTDKQRYVKQSTYAAYALILENHILPNFGECEALSEKHVQEFVLQKLSSGLSTKLVINTPKTKNSCREIPMSKELLAMVKPLKKVVNQDYYVLTNEEKPTEPRTYRNYYHRLMARLDIPRLKYHGLRHSFATRCIESNCDYKTVSVPLGHANITTTLNLYVHPNMEQKKRCITKMLKSLG